MFKNYIKIAFRNLLKNKSQTFINVGGLTLGIICAIVIFLIIQFDLSFDKWHDDSDRIYRVVRHETEFGKSVYYRGGPYPLAEAVRNDVTGIEYSTLVFNNLANEPIISYYDNGNLVKKLKESDFAFVDPDYFNILTYTWLSGNPETAIKNPNTAVVTQSFAMKLFGTTDVLGKSVVFNGGTAADIEITGVVKDMPENSDFPFTFIGANSTMDRNGDTAENPSWGSNSSSMQTYIKLESGITEEQVNEQLEALIVKYRSEEVAAELDLFLQPLSEIHFDSRFNNYNGRVIEKSMLLALGIIGLFLLIAACINFINLNTAIAVSRSKEVGLRKTLGGTKSQLMLHFFGETAFITLIALALGVGLSEIVLQNITPILGFSPEMNLLSNVELQLFIVSIFLLVTLMAGWYPAQHLSNFNPIEAIRNKIQSNYGKGLTLRRGLIVVQFTITQVLIICTLIMASQIRYFKNQDLGFEKDAVVHVPIQNEDMPVLNVFKSSLLNKTTIQNVSFSNTGTTSNSVWGGNYIMIEDSIRHENSGQVKFIDENFIDTYGLTLLAGTNIQPSDTVNAYIVNQSFAKEVGYGDNLSGLIGKTTSMWGTEAPIVGVVKDFNTQSLHEGLSPVLLAPRKSFFLSAIKINTTRTKEALGDIEKAFNTAFPDLVFEYSFLDETIESMYEDEQRTAKIMNAFTFIAIIIGSLGLFGLVSYMSTTRTKEIGVRKVLGANLLDILKLFGTELALLTGISFVIAAPVSWYLMRNWLEDFAYKIELGIGIFLIALSAILLISVLTIGYKSLRAALANPIESLKSE
ncbi:FtsX-like permease family protein [bacterium]|nr:FtsX-like permease family protein [bacterium]